MVKQVVPYLRDILKYARHIQKQSEHLAEKDFRESFGKQCELIRCLEVIGEATKRISNADAKFFLKYPQVSWSSMVKMRDFLIHHYQEANIPRLWNTIKNHVPQLVEQMQSILVEDLKTIPYPLFIRGKVRDVYDLGDKLLMVASDRISAYDYVLATPIPDKGKILTQVSAFWFEQLKGIVHHHLISMDVRDFPADLHPFEKELAGRSMLVRKTDKINIECVVRGYLSGSGWKEYQKTQSVCAVALPSGLKESSKLPQPIFTPATKEDGGKHDENISFDRMCAILGTDLSEKLRKISIDIFKCASEICLQKGLILADTKFEFGLLGEEIILIDEVLTPDSSRFWEIPASGSKGNVPNYEGTSPTSFDKQFVRNHLDAIAWDRKPPVPSLSQEVVQKTRAKYIEAFKKITGQSPNL